MIGSTTGSGSLGSTIAAYGIERMTPTVRNIQVVDEDLVVQAVKQFGEDSAFGIILGVANEYRQADMTPIFLWDVDERNVYCVAAETYRKKLH